MSSADRRRRPDQVRKVPLHPNCVHEMVREAAARFPRNAAVSGPAGSLTYEELLGAADGVCRALRAMDLSPEAVVGVLLDRSPSAVAAMLGTMQAGCGFLPLNPRDPQRRIESMLRESSASLVVTDGSGLEKVGGHRVIDVSRVSESIHQASDARVEVRSDQLIYVMFTSGSSGTPKGVMVEHRMVANVIDWHTEHFAVTPGDRAAQFAPLHFDASVYEIWPYLSAGATVVIVPEPVKLFPTSLARWLVENRITCGVLPPAVLERLLDLPMPGASLRFLITGGDRLNRRPDPSFGVPVINAYGPTEATILATAGIVEPAGTAPRPPTIGRPISGVSVYVLDELGQHVQTGTVGELYIGGEGVARGYINNRHLSDSSFVPDPFRGGGRRMYRTGDYGSYDEDGRIEFVGRRDEQVQLGGVRVEVGEVEHALASLDGLLNVAVIAVENHRGVLELVAFVVRSSGAVTRETILRHLSRTLAPAATPRRFEFLEEMPLTSTGKIDKRRLVSTLRRGADQVEPRF